MRIGVDACCWANDRGYGRYTRELLRALVASAPEHDFHLLADPRAAGLIDLSGPNVHVETVRLGEPPVEAAASGGSRSPLDLLRMARAVRRLRPDIFFSPSVYSWFPLFPGQPAVVCVHDAIADEHPDLTLPGLADRLLWKLKVRAALGQSDLVLTVSRFSAERISRVLGVPEGRIRVAEEAPAAAYRPGDPERARAAADRIGLPENARWFVYVGGFNPHKRVDVVVRAHARLVRDLDDPPHLLLVGSVDGDVFHGHREEIREEVARAGTGDRVHWTGFVPDDELRHLHAGALALVLASECEGFGLPAVEAAACGTPVVATERSPLPELLDGGGLFVPPGDEDALVRALRRMSRDADFREAAGRTALERASRLSWERTASRALDTLAEAAA